MPTMQGMYGGSKAAGEYKANLVASWHSLRCRVTLYDLKNEMRRTPEVQADSPEAAAEAALRWQLGQDRFPADFGPVIEVEVISTTPYKFSLQSVAKRISPCGAPQARAA